MKEKLYFAHPISHYNSSDEKLIIEELRKLFPSATIINPATDIPRPKVTGYMDCKDCMQKHMKPIYFKAIAKCDIFAIWSPRDTCGIRCELHKAWELGKEVVSVNVGHSGSLRAVHIKPLQLREYSRLYDD
jgi:hypothetical protein